MAEQRDNARFVADLAHELRTPLAVILGHAELLIELDDTDVRASATAIHDAAVALEEILRRRADEQEATTP